MPATGLPDSSLRWGRAESSRLARAFVISLGCHLLVFSCYKTGERLHLWQNLQLPAWMQPPRLLTQLLVKKPTPKELAQLQPSRQEQVPLMFVDVNPAKATPEPPKQADYYSDKNSQAANPDTSTESTTPKIDGQQTEVPKTEDVPRTKAFPLQPALPEPDPPQPTPPQTPPPQTPPPQTPPSQTPPPQTPLPQTAPPQTPPPQTPPPQTARLPTPPPQAPPPRPAPPTEEHTAPADKAQPMPVLAPGDLALAKPQEALRPGPAQPEMPRPRTLAEARARQPQRYAQAPGQKMKQEGGVRRHALESSLNVLATPFGAYDAALIDAVRNRWYDLLDQRSFAGARTGKVMLQFHLNADGHVSEMRLMENTVDLTLALLCESAIRDPAPFNPWPGELRRLVGADYREVTFTFYYR